MAIAEMLCRESFLAWTPAKLIWSLEMWEIYWLCYNISERYKKIEKDKGHTTGKNIEHWKRDSTKMTHEALQTIEKIKRGEL